MRKACTTYLWESSLTAAVFLSYYAVRFAASRTTRQVPLVNSMCRRCASKSSASQLPNFVPNYSEKPGRIWYVVQYIGPFRRFRPHTPAAAYDIIKKIRFGLFLTKSLRCQTFFLRGRCQRWHVDRFDMLLSAVQ